MHETITFVTRMASWRPLMRWAGMACVALSATCLSGCAVVAVADAAVSVAATAVKVTATVVETTVDVAASGVKAVTSDGEKGEGLADPPTGPSR